MKTACFSPPSPADIRRMFARISRRYDRFNTINSLGIHRRWRNELVRYSGATSDGRILDCATGTGDVAFAFERALGKNARIMGVDFCREMLDVAQAKRKKRASGVIFQEADILHLPFPDRSFDVVSLAFGARNIPTLSSALREMARVTRPGGALLILEAGRPQNPLLARIVDLYYRHFVAGVSARWTGNAPDYGYLDQSTARFGLGDRLFQASKEAASFAGIQTRPLSFGLVHLYRLIVPPLEHLSHRCLNFEAYIPLEMIF